jgi:hypothetical protein
VPFGGLDGSGIALKLPDKVTGSMNITRTFQPVSVVIPLLVILTSVWKKVALGDDMVLHDTEANACPLNNRPGNRPAISELILKNDLMGLIPSIECFFCKSLESKPAYANLPPADQAS